MGRILVQRQRTDNNTIEEEVVVIMAKEEAYGVNKAQYLER